jgi:hypothetical protein
MSAFDRSGKRSTTFPMGTQLAAVTRLCLMCGNPLIARAREHVFPQWLLEHLGIRDERVRGIHWKHNGTGFEEKPVSLREMDYASMTEGRVCATCNQGWMSQLEDNARPLLIKMIDGSCKIGSLKDSETALLGRWAAKTSYMLNSSANFNLRVPETHRQILRNGDLIPSNVAVVATQHIPTERSHWVQNSSWNVIGHKPSEEQFLRELELSAYKIVLQFGQLIIMTFSYPHERTVPVLWRGVHHPIVNRPSIWLNENPQQFNSSGRTEDAVVEFSVMAGLCRFLD